MRLQVTRAKNGSFILTVGEDSYVSQAADEQDKADKSLGLQLRTAYDEWQKAGGTDAPQDEPRRRARAEVIDDDPEDFDDGENVGFLEMIGEAGKLMQAASSRFPSRHRKRAKPEPEVKEDE